MQRGQLVKQNLFKELDPPLAVCSALGLCQNDRQGRARGHLEQPAPAAEVSGWRLSGFTSLPSSSDAVSQTPALTHPRDLNPCFPSALEPAQLELSGPGVLFMAGP